MEWYYNEQHTINEIYHNILGFFVSNITHMRVMITVCTTSGFGGEVHDPFLGLTVHIDLVLMRFVPTHYTPLPTMYQFKHFEYLSMQILYA